MNIEALLNELDWAPIEYAEPPDPACYATHEAVLRIGDAALRCYQSNTGERVVDAADLEAFLEGRGR